MSKDVVKKLSAWHAAIVDWEFFNPEKNMSECAKRFGVTEPWLSSLRNSDLFVAYREERRQNHNGMVSETVIDKAERVAGITLDVMAEKLEKEGTDISFSALTEVGGLMLKSLGFGERQAQNIPSGFTVNIDVASSGALKEAREKMAQLREDNAKEVKVIDNDGDVSQDALPAPG